MIKNTDYRDARLISRVLTLYYMENLYQSEIARTLGLSTAKVNRILKSARNQGMVEVKIHAPYQNLFDLERALQERAGIAEAVVIPRLADDDATVFRTLGQAAASHLMEHIQDGDTICISGGRALYEMVQAVEPCSFSRVRVVPGVGGVQGCYHTDTNSLAAELAKRLGGRAYQLHAPAFVDTPAEKETICNIRHVKEVLEIARQAQIALVGVGNITPEASSYLHFTSLPPAELQEVITKEDGAGEILAQIFNSKGQPCALDYASRTIGLNLTDLYAIPLTIGVAALNRKAGSLAAALRGRYLKTLITDESTAKEILDNF